MTSYPIAQHMRRNIQKARQTDAKQRAKMERQALAFRAKRKVTK